MTNGIKTGVYTVATLLVKACRVHDKYAPSFTAFINASSLTSDEKVQALAAIAAVSGACEILRKLTKLA